MALFKSCHNIASLLGFGSKIFKIKLEKLFAIHDGIPGFLITSINYIRSHINTDLHIFKVKPDNNKLYQHFIRECEQNNIQRFIDEHTDKNETTIMISWFLKEFFEKLPDSLISHENNIGSRLLNYLDYNSEDNMDIDVKLNYIKCMITSLKEEHYIVLKEMISLLNTIIFNENMEGNNKDDILSLHYLPKLLGPIFVKTKKGKNMDTYEGIQSQQLCVFLIKYYDVIFEHNYVMKYNHLMREHNKLNIKCNNLQKYIENNQRKRLRFQVFLVWKNQVSRIHDIKKLYGLVNDLKNNLTTQNEQMQHKNKQIISLQQKLDINKFERNLERCSMIVKNDENITEFTKQIHKMEELNPNDVKTLKKWLFNSKSNTKIPTLNDKYFNSNVNQIQSLRDYDKNIIKNADIEPTIKLQIDC